MGKNFLKHLSQKNGYILRLDDIAPNMNWKMMDRAKNLFDKFDIKPILGVIPKNEDVELKSYPLCQFDFWEEIRKFKKNNWEISMHGYEHLYEKSSKKNDYLGHGGNTEFAGHTYEHQLKKLTLGLEIFKQQEIEVTSFIAPNHTFDKNTIKAIKTLGLSTIVDGYGFIPYYESDLLFIPQLLYRLYPLPLGIQTFQIHLNYYSNEDYIRLERFVNKYKESIISFDQASKMARNNFIDKDLRTISKKTLQLKRAII